MTEKRLPTAMDIFIETGILPSIFKFEIGKEYYDNANYPFKVVEREGDFITVEDERNKLRLKIEVCDIDSHFGKGNPKFLTVERVKVLGDYMNAKDEVSVVGRDE